MNTNIKELTPRPKDPKMNENMIGKDFLTLARFAQAAKHAKKDSVSYNNCISKLGDLCGFALRLAQGLEPVETAREITYPQFQYFSLWLRLWVFA